LIHFYKRFIYNNEIFFLNREDILAQKDHN